METDTDEAVGNARSRRGSATFDKQCVTELRVKQKYMGHRNARYTFSFVIVITFTLVIAND